ncbi:MAG: hypothetical protein CL912_12050 [Deltaproteobacteria bacterium]|nr:hypothetical protein [Deltaproteobacteria bacterium]
MVLWSYHSSQVSSFRWRLFANDDWSENIGYGRSSKLGSLSINPAVLTFKYCYSEKFHRDCSSA